MIQFSPDDSNPEITRRSTDYMEAFRVEAKDGSREEHSPHRDVGEEEESNLHLSH